MRAVKFYFDFISPYGYIAAEQVEDLAAKYGRKVEWHPMLLGVSVMRVMGLKPLLETPLKGEYVLKDVPRLAQIYGLPLMMPKQGLPKPVPPGRAFCWAKKQYPERAGQFARAIYRAFWQNGMDIGEVNVLVELAKGLGFDGGDLRGAIDGADVRQALRIEVERSLALGVFGSPTFLVDGEMIWGVDRVWMVERVLAASSLSSTPR